MSTRSRIVGFGGAGVLVVAGIAAAILVGGGTGQVLALVLISLGFVLATSLTFFEVGASEDRDLERSAEREREQREQRARPRAERRIPIARRLPRMRGSRRRL